MGLGLVRSISAQSLVWALVGAATLWSGDRPVSADEQDTIPQNMFDVCRDAAGPPDSGGGVVWERLDAPSAIELCEEALQQDPDDPALMAFLGRALRKAGRHEESVRYIRSSAEAGNLAGMVLMGWGYQHGVGVAEDDAEALRWYLLAANQGYAWAQNNLASMYRSGEGIEENDGEALRLFRMAAEDGDAPAQNNLGAMYDNGEGVAEDNEEAVRWYRMAASQGYGIAQANLGWMYETGEGVVEDDAEAVRWYRLAIAQGNAQAQNNLGAMYDKGEGVEEDDEEAVRLYRLAAEQGHGHAQNNLGWMHYNGQGVEQSDTAAARWYLLAAERGIGPAPDNLLRLLNKDPSAETDLSALPEGTAPWLRRGLESGTLPAKQVLRAALTWIGRDQQAEELGRLAAARLDDDVVYAELVRASERAPAVLPWLEAVAREGNPVARRVLAEEAALAQESLGELAPAAGRQVTAATARSNEEATSPFVTLAFWQIIVIAAGVVVLGAILYYARAAARSARAAADASRQQVRAYVLVDGATVVERDGRTEVEVVLVNSGHTPAFKVRAALRLEGEGGDTPADAGAERVADMGAGSRHVLRAAMPQQGSATLYAHGVVGYEDVLGKAHSTHIRYQCSDGVAFVVSPEGNEAD